MSFRSLLLHILVTLLLVPSSLEKKSHEYKSASGNRILIIPAGHIATREHYESRVEFYSPRNKKLCALDLTSEDGEHGQGVVKAAWTPDSQYFVFSLTSSGGHQSWHFETLFYSQERGTICSLDDYVGRGISNAGISRGEFQLRPPNTVSTEVWTGESVPVEVSLDSLREKQGKQAVHPRCRVCSSGEVITGVF